MCVLLKGRKYRQIWRMVGPIQNLDLMMCGIKNLERNYIHWFSLSIWRIQKTKTYNWNKPHRFLLVWFGFRTEPEIIDFISVWFVWIIGLIVILWSAYTYTYIYISNSTITIRRFLIALYGIEKYSMKNWKCLSDSVNASSDLACSFSSISTIPRHLGNTSWAWSNLACSFSSISL